LLVTVRELTEGHNALLVTVRELTEGQKALQVTVRELTEGQKALQVTVRELTEGQKALQVTVRELTEAQKRTEVRLKRMQEDIGALRHTVGFTLEDRAYVALPRLLKRDHAVEVTGRLVRRHLPLKEGGYVELNIIGKGIRNGRGINIVGDAKTQLFRRDVRRFQQVILPMVQAELGEVFPVLVTHMTPEPKIEEFIREQGFVLYYSYDFDTV
jgi:hypothetical protein